MELGILPMLGEHSTIELHTSPVLIMIILSNEFVAIFLEFNALLKLSIMSLTCNEENRLQI
jgi:hypothetical protein